MKYSVVIPTYNNCNKYLKPCIDSIIKYTNLDDIELIVSANGCTDETEVYLMYLNHVIPNLVVVWNKKPLGFAKAINEGIKVASTDKIVLLNNDIVLLEQSKNKWLEMLDTGHITGPLSLYSKITDKYFIVFFCVMIPKNIIETIGLLPEHYAIGGSEDIEYCLLAENLGFQLITCGYNNIFPIYHKAQGTMNDEKLVKDWKQQFFINELKLAEKYNLEHYKFLLTNNYERAVFLKDDPVLPRETARYLWARHNVIGKNVLEIGCSTGYGVQFLSKDILYTGIDYDTIIIEVALKQKWNDYSKFICADINELEITFQDSIIAFEVIEHLDNGLELINKLKASCKNLLISVPYNEPIGFWGEHHKLHFLTEKDFPDFEFQYIDENGVLTQELNKFAKFSLMVCRWTNA